MPSGATHPVGERRTVEIDPLPGVNLRLTIKRQMIGVFGNEHMRDGRFGRQAAFDQTRRDRRLRDAFLAGSASVFGPPRHQDAELRRHDIETLGDILADPVKLTLAARTGLVVDIDDGFDARHMGGQRAAIAPAPARGFGAGRCRLAFGLCSVAGLCLPDVFERQQHLVFGKRLGASSEAMTPHLLDDLNEPLVARPLGEQHRLQLVRGIGERFDRLRHERSRSYLSAPRDNHKDHDSLYRRSAGQSWGRRLFRAHALPIQTLEQRRKLRR